MKKALICLLIPSGGLFPASGSETKIQFHDLPAAVQTAAQQQSKGSSVRGYSKELEGGKTYYEVETRSGGKNKDILLDERGSVVEIEQEMDMKAVPDVVIAGLKKAASGGQILSVESVTKAGTVGYEAVVLTSGKKHEVAVDGSGNAKKED